MNVFLDANVCLDLLDSTRPTSRETIAWYMQHKDRIEDEFYFSADFITTIYYHLTQKRKLACERVIDAIDLLCLEITPLYLVHSDFQLAKKSFSEKNIDDFEDLMVLHSAIRQSCESFITNDRHLTTIGQFFGMKIVSPLI